MNPIRTSINKAFAEDRPARILSLFYDGYFERDLARTGHEIYGSIEDTTITWDYPWHQMIDNIHLLPADFHQYNNTVEFDLVMCNERVHQYQKAAQLSYALHAPLILVDHFSPQIDWSYTQIEQLIQSRQNRVSVSCSHKIGADWKNPVGPIVYPCGENFIFNKHDKSGVLMHGTFLQNEYHFIEYVRHKVDGIKIVGNNPGFTESPAYNELLDMFRKAQIYVNLSTVNGFSWGLIHALKAGCAIVTTQNPLLANFFLDDDVKFVFDVDDIPAAVEEIKNDTETCDRLQKTSLKRSSAFDTDKFVKSWDEIIKKYQYESHYG